MLRLRYARGAERPHVVVMTDDAPSVVVDAEEVELLADEIEVGGGEVWPCSAEDLAHLLGIASLEDGIEILPVHVRVGAARRGEIVGTLRRRVLRLEIDDKADLMLSRGAIGAHGHRVGAKQVVRGDRRLVEIGVSRGQQADEVAAIRHDPRLVERRPVLHPAIERAEHHVCILGEPLGDVGIEPAAAVVERRRKVPMIERRKGRDAFREQRIDESLVKGESLRIHAPLPFGEHTAPRYAEAIRAQTKLAHQLDIRRPAAVVVARDVAGITVCGATLRVGEALPDARTRAVGERRTFDLIRGCGRAPQETVREAIV